MNATQTFRELTHTMRPQDPHGDGTGLRFETGEHGGAYPDNMPQAITATGGEPKGPTEAGRASLDGSLPKDGRAT